MGLRPGPENIPACIGLGAAATLAARCCGEAGSTLYELRKRLTKGLIDTISPTPVFLCEQSDQLPNTIAIEMPGSAKRIQKAARQLAVATALSSSPPDEMTRALRAIERTDSQVARTIRVSLGWTTSQSQIDRTIDLLADAWDSVARA
jgi:cysteine desulfurase